MENLTFHGIYRENFHFLSTELEICIFGVQNLHFLSVEFCRACSVCQMHCDIPGCQINPDLTSQNYFYTQFSNIATANSIPNYMYQVNAGTNEI